MNFEIEEFKKIPKLSNPILIEGLPGLGNVGKVAVDFLIDTLKPIKWLEMVSFSLPNSVFVTENNQISLPGIQIHYKKRKNQDLVLITGDAQPTEPKDSYEFSQWIIDIAVKLKIKEIITIGGIGLSDIKSTPKVYCTGNNARLIKQYANIPKVEKHIYGVVGPIIGVSGLLLGLSKKHRIPAITLLAETLNHPLYLGIKGSKEVLKIINKRLGLALKFSTLDKEIKEIETEILRRTQEISQNSGSVAAKSYIG